MKNFILLLSISFLLVSSCAKISDISYEITETSTRAEDEKTLSDFFSEIKQFSESVECTNAERWRFTEYGSKACGGPQGYIAYSIQKNTKDFLNKVEVYTELEDKYNIKWDIISDCAIPPAPNSLKCINGKPEFFY